MILIHIVCDREYVSALAADLKTREPAPAALTSGSAEKYLGVVIACYRRSSLPEAVYQHLLDDRRVVDFHLFEPFWENGGQVSTQ